MSNNPKNKKNSLFPIQETDDEDDSSWQVSYLDIITILLGFLVILLSFSQLRQLETFSVSSLFKSSENETEFITTPIEAIKKELEDLLDDELKNEKIEIKRDLNDLVIRFSSDELYSSGSADLKPQANVLLDRVIEALKQTRYDDFDIDVEGHTDNSPISTVEFPSNWELSTRRASNVVKYFSQQGIEENRLKASGYADSRPLITIDSNGNPIPVEKKLNRRIVLRLYYTFPDSSIVQSSQEESLADVPEFELPEPAQENNRNLDILAIENAFRDSLKAAQLQRDRRAQQEEHKTQPMPQQLEKCQYSVQIGGFESFSNSISFAENAEQKTGNSFIITYNNRLFSVRSKATSSFSNISRIQKRVSAEFRTLTNAVIHHCYENSTELPSPLRYTIQLGFFQNIDGANNFANTLKNQHQVPAKVNKLGLQSYSVSTEEYSTRREALKQLQIIKDKKLSNNVILKYVPDSISEYNFSFQLQLVSFSDREQADRYAETISNRTGAEIRVKNYGEGIFYVVTEKSDDWDQTMNLYNEIRQLNLNQPPVIYLLEFR